jgi:outer membrane protein TolC
LKEEFLNKMNKKIKNILNYTSLIASILLCCSTNLYAQSLDSLINEAILNNPQIKSLAYKIKSAEYKANSVNTYPPPTVALELSQIPFNTVNWINEPMGQSITISQMFMLGGKLEAMSNAEKKNIAVGENDLQVYKVSLTGNIRMSYYNLWLIDRKMSIQQETIDLLNQLLTSATNLYEVNKINQADIFTLQSEIAANEAQLVVLKNERESAIYKMNKFLGRDLDSKTLIISEVLPSVKATFSIDELEKQLNDNNPDLKKMNSMIEMKQLEINANSKEKIPDLMLSGMFMRMPKGMFLTTQTPADMIGMGGGTDYAYGLMASVTLPFVPWSRDKYEAKEQEMLSDISSIQASRTEMQRDMQAQLKAAYLKMKSSEELMALFSDKVIPIYEQARTAQVSLYQNNQATVNSVIDISRMMLMQVMNNYMAQADRLMSIAEMEMMLGTSLGNK